MQTDGKPSHSGLLLGYTGLTRCQASFMYDWRGPRSSSALELVQWIDPPTEGQPYDDVSIPGLHAIAFGVESLDQIEWQITRAGGVALPQRSGSPFGTVDVPAILLRDPDGATVEVVEGNFPATTILGIRATCSNLDASIRFYEMVGFEVVNGPTTGKFIWGEGRTATLALPEDEDGFKLCVAQPNDVAVNCCSYGTAHHSGFTRMALRVDDARDTHRQLSSEGLILGGPFPVDLGGTAVQDLHIACINDPDGILVEFVDRPKRFFRPPPPYPGERNAVSAP
jgi:catechol 2,3-dioxygenase-like lactoylglutathione lyase family enzyme